MTRLAEPAARRVLIAAMARAMIGHAEELTALDAAIGDGDHGINMKRGFEAVLADIDAIAAKPLPQALGAVGTTLVMKVGGASGPLYGTLFMQLGKALPESPTLADFAAAAETALTAVKARGKSETGCKTMLDVLAPALAALREGIATPDALFRALPAAALAAADATIPMRAVRGRASFLGERSIGHLDPGARSSALLIGAACAALEEMA
ncbi:MAG: dihydroxyacetone kinase subunit L [Proteobacteria bacterium]|nr:dihydroxyacetone kinase subunit L [Pseudomonadota bacterium]